MHKIEAPPPPVPPSLDSNDRKTVLVERLNTVLVGLPSYFEFNNHVAGVIATDLHSLNTLLGASIESQVVKALNQQRKLWDPDDDWLGFTFERQSQTFPDVRLVKKGHGQAEVALGIELKGWFLLAKEGMPSFRFTTTPAATTAWDLLVVVPWYLDNVLSGSPVCAEPFVQSARYVAEFRNYWWEHMRQVASGRSKAITIPAGAHPYPTSDVQIADVPDYDGGSNFGRLARVTGLMSDFVKESNDLEVLGIRIGDWHSFLQKHSDQADPDAVSEQLRTQLRRTVARASQVKADALADAMQSIADILIDG